MANFVFISTYDEYCLGVRQICSVLQRGGHRARRIHFYGLGDVVDWQRTKGMVERDAEDGFFAKNAIITTEEFALFRELLRELKPDAVGISLTSNFFGLAKRITREIRQAVDAVVVWGGIDPTINPEMAIEHADVVCSGEGEYPMLELAERIDSGQDYAGIRNLWFRRDGEIIKEPMRPLLQDLDELPFCDYEESNDYVIQNGKCKQGFPEGSRLPADHMIMAARGCPYRCSYCINSVTPRTMYKGQKYLRRRSPEHVIAELKERKSKYHLNYVDFYDDIFPVDKRWILEFAPMYRDEIGAPFWCYVYPSYCDPTLIKALKEAGLVEVTMGVQSGSEEVLYNVYDRRTKASKVKESADILKDIGVDLKIDLIGHNPYETDDDCRMTLELLLSLPRPFLIEAVNPLTFYLKFPLTEKALNDGHIVAEKGMFQNKYFQKYEPRYDFWAALYYLTPFPEIPAEVLLDLSRNEYMRDNPGALTSMKDIIFKAVFTKGHQYSPRKDDYIRQLEGRINELEDELARLRGRKTVKLDDSLRRIFQRAGL